MSNNKAKVMSVDWTNEGYEATSCCEDTTNSSSHITEPAAPLSPPQSSPIMEETIPAQYYYHQVLDQHNESRDYTNFVNDNGLQTPSMNSLAEDNSGDFSQPALEKVENVEHDTFIDHLDDLDMADMTLSPVNTPLPNYNTTIPTSRPIQVPPSPVTPIRRRRIIVEEESDQSQGDEAAERVVKDLGEITQQSIKQIPRGGNAQNTNKKSRILTDITMAVLPRGSGISSYSASHPIELNVNSMTSVQSQKDQLMPLSDFVPLTQTQQGLQQSLEPQQQQQQQDQQVQKRQPQQKAQKQRLHQRKSFSKKSSLSIISQDVESLGLLQVRGPGRQETQRVNQMISQESSTGFVADVSSSISSIVSPLAGASSSASTPNPVTVLESNVRGPKANTTNVFTMSQPVQFYVAESSSYLPLLVHAPRYLRSRRKRSRLGRSLIKRMTPIVHSVNMMKLSNGETPTPEITSPENSYLSHNAFISTDSPAA
ncbi:hypothetical protein BGZ49_009608 [Haplosporangium sp. Z 27]|nr:hypothetical protein BGZ49_009608 [Haplosporangium sp. Z 27]